MSERVSLVVSTVTQSQKVYSKSITDINPNATSQQLINAVDALFSLTTRTVGKILRVATTEITSSTSTEG